MLIADPTPMPPEEGLPVITCVLIAYPDGVRIWEPLRDYLQNPPQNSYVVREQRSRTSATSEISAIPRPSRPL